MDRAAGEHLGKAEDEYRRKYYAALDILVACNNQRFEENNYDMHVMCNVYIIWRGMRKVGELLLWWHQQWFAESAAENIASSYRFALSLNSVSWFNNLKTTLEVWLVK